MTMERAETSKAFDKIIRAYLDSHGSKKKGVEATAEILKEHAIEFVKYWNANHYPKKIYEKRYKEWID